MIHKSAIVSPNAKIADNVKIGPFTIIEDNVEIGSGTEIGSHVVICNHTKIGERNKIFQYSAIGEAPQDIGYKDEPTSLEIGNDNIIREFCTLHRGTTKDKGVTRIGSNNFLMAYAHIAHDCQLGNHIIFANNASLAGHAIVDDYVVMGGFAAIYQFCHLGEHCFISAGALVNKDVLPFIRVSGGGYAKPAGINTEGLRRRGFDADKRDQLKKAYKIVFREGLTTSDAIDKLKVIQEGCPEVEGFIRIMESAKFGICR